MITDYLKEIITMAHQAKNPYRGGRGGRKSIEDILGAEVPEEDRPPEVEEPEEGETETPGSGRVARKPDVWEGQDDYIFKSGDQLVDDDKEVSDPKLDISNEEKAIAIIKDINNLIDTPEWYMGTLNNFKKIVAVSIINKYPKLRNLIKFRY